MKHTNRMRWRNNVSLKRIAYLTLALSCISVVPIATATTKHSPSGEILWCLGDGTTPYADILGFPAATLPFGKSTKDPTFGINPPDSWDPWGTNPDLKADPLTKSTATFGDKLETREPFGVSTMSNDRYAVQLNYWNSIVNGNPAYKDDKAHSEPGLAPFGHSPGHSCLLFMDFRDPLQPKFNFTITYPATQSQPDPREVAFHRDHPDDYPQFVPYADGPTSGGPTGYVSVFKGCSWDGNSCTSGSAIPAGDNPVPAPTGDINKFPVQLTNITHMYTSWDISYDSRFGEPWTKDKTKHVWDASYDIWFDKTGNTALGEAPYNQDPPKHDARGQNDGLEIMIWMDSNGSYVDAGEKYKPPYGGQPGLAQPTGFMRERVTIGGVYYDVWVGRLNNPYFGYKGQTIVKPQDIPGNCPLSFKMGAKGQLCGVEWNVVSFVASKDRYGNDSRRQSGTFDIKDFTDYLLGIPNPNVVVHLFDTSPSRDHKPLLCPASNKDQKDQFSPSAECLNQAWYVTSIQAGFETWIGGNGLRSDRFSAYVENTPVIATKQLMNASGTPVVNYRSPFTAVYNRCKSYSTTNHAAITITGSNGTSTITYPTNGSKIDLGAQDPKSLQFKYTISDPLFPIRGDAVVHYNSACGNFDASVFFDTTGKVFYQDGVTPLTGAAVTLQYSPSGNKAGPFIAVPDMNKGLTPAVMQANGNIRNPMRSASGGFYGWNVIPGWYRINVTSGSTSVTTAAYQVTTTKPLQDININLPIIAPASFTPPLPLTAGVTTKLTLNGADWAKGYCRNLVLTNTNTTAVTWRVQFTLPFKGNIDPKNFWNMNYVQSGDTVTAWGVGWNDVLQPGQVLNTSGFCASK